MNSFNTSIHRRRSIRLKDYDYSQAALYFITICCENRHHLFGEILGDKMKLNNAGENAKQCWMSIPQHFPNVQLHEFVIMPNHIHGIIEFVGAKNLSPDGGNESIDIEINDDWTNGVRAKDFSPLRGTSKTIGSVVRGFKVGVTKWMRQNTDVLDVWQRNYFEHIIRNENSFDTIREYIITNPEKWPHDKFYS
jgi:putative transposase